MLTEYRFHPVRKWRADYAHEPTRLLIEVEGGAWGGRHSRGGGFLKDAEKYLEATLRGWLVVRLTAPLINTENLLRVKELLDKRKNQLIS